MSVGDDKAKTGAMKAGFECHHCGKTFTLQGNLRRHVKEVHGATEGNQCSTCGKAFARKADLEMHQRVHTGEKPFACKHCGRQFARISDLRSHERTHMPLRNKRYICTFPGCSVGFLRRHDLKKHAFAKHEEWSRTAAGQAALEVEPAVPRPAPQSHSHLPEFADGVSTVCGAKANATGVLGPMVATTGGMAAPAAMAAAPCAAAAAAATKAAAASQRLRMHEVDQSHQSRLALSAPDHVAHVPSHATPAAAKTSDSLSEQQETRPPSSTATAAAPAVAAARVKAAGSAASSKRPLPSSGRLVCSKHTVGGVPHAKRRRCSNHDGSAVAVVVAAAANGDAGEIGVATHSNRRGRPADATSGIVGTAAAASIVVVAAAAAAAAAAPSGVAAAAMPAAAPHKHGPRCGHTAVLHKSSVRPHVDYYSPSGILECNEAGGGHSCTAAAATTAAMPSALQPQPCGGISGGISSGGGNSGCHSRSKGAAAAAAAAEGDVAALTADSALRGSCSSGHASHWDARRDGGGDGGTKCTGGPRHSAECGHSVLHHGDHLDYVVDGRLLHVKDSNWLEVEDHGEVTVLEDDAALFLESVGEWLGTGDTNAASAAVPQGGAAAAGAGAPSDNASQRRCLQGPPSPLLECGCSFDVRDNGGDDDESFYCDLCELGLDLPVVQENAGAEGDRDGCGNSGYGGYGRHEGSCHNKQERSGGGDSGGKRGSCGDDGEGRNGNRSGAFRGNDSKDSAGSAGASSGDDRSSSNGCIGGLAPQKDATGSRGTTCTPDCVVWPTGRWQWIPNDPSDMRTPPLPPPGPPPLSVQPWLT